MLSTFRNFLEIYSTNGGCKLPCWWGITPGKTSLEEVQQYFDQFAGLEMLKERDEILENEDPIRIFEVNLPPINPEADYRIPTRFEVKENTFYLH